MPKYDTDIDLSGVWHDEVEADNADEAIRKAIRNFEEASAEDILNCIEPFHPEPYDVGIWKK